MDLRSRNVDLGGASIHYREGGEGQPVVLVHGWLESSTCWLRVLERLMPRYRCYALDLVGFGQSVPGPVGNGFDVKSNARILQNFLETRLDRPAHLVGHSMGGMVALSVAAARPDLALSLTLASTPIDGPNAVRKLLQIVGLPGIRESTFKILRARSMTRFVSGYFVNKGEVPESMLDEAMAVSPEAMFGSVSSILSTNLEPLLEKVKVPSLVVFGDHDRIVDVGQGALAADRLRDVEFKLMRGLGHCPQVEDPYGFAALLLQFLPQVQQHGARAFGVVF